MEEKLSAKAGDGKEPSSRTSWPQILTRLKLPLAFALPYLLVRLFASLVSAVCANPCAWSADMLEFVRFFTTSCGSFGPLVMVCLGLGFVTAAAIMPRAYGLLLFLVGIFLGLPGLPDCCGQCVQT